MLGLFQISTVVSMPHPVHHCTFSSWSRTSPAVDPSPSSVNRGSPGCPSACERGPPRYARACAEATPEFDLCLGCQIVENLSSRSSQGVVVRKIQATSRRPGYELILSSRCAAFDHGIASRAIRYAAGAC